MLTDLELLHELAAAAPSFQASWDESDPLAYIEVADLVRHLRAKLAKGEINEVSAVFDLTESLLANEEVEPGFITIGLFEGIQNLRQIPALTRKPGNRSWDRSLEDSGMSSMTFGAGLRRVTASRTGHWARRNQLGGCSQNPGFSWAPWLSSYSATSPRCARSSPRK
jgi:hypothetical protein